MISKSSSLSHQQLLVVRVILSSILQIRKNEVCYANNCDMRSVAICLGETISKWTVDTDWRISVISATHHTSNIILACKSLNKDNRDKSFVLKVQVFSLSDSVTLLSEAAFYQSHKGDYLPAFLGFFCEDDLFAIALEYLDGYQKFSSFVWEENITKSEAHTLIVPLLTLASSDLFLDGNVENTSIDSNWTVFKKLFLDRAFARLTEKTILDSSFKAIALLDKCTINDVVLPGPMSLLSRILEGGRHIANYLPSSLGSIHGDLHFGNILVNKEVANERNKKNISRMFVFVDPRFCGPGPLIYDLGKIYQSFWGHYEAILRGTYMFDRKSTDNFNLRFHEPPDFIAFGEELANCVKSSCLNRNYERDAEDLHLVCIMSAGIHFIAAAPHHILKEEESIVMLLWGCFLVFNSFEKLYSRIDSKLLI